MHRAVKAKILVVHLHSRKTLYHYQGARPKPFFVLGVLSVFKEVICAAVYLRQLRLRQPKRRAVFLNKRYPRKPRFALCPRILLYFYRVPRYVDRAVVTAEPRPHDALNRERVYE